MTKTLSEQLCEICGIKPIMKACKHYDRLEQCCALDKCDDIDCPYKPPFTYPDFTKPENFVKLLEIMTNQTTKEELALIVTRLRVERGDLINNKKQAIREADWNWE